MTTIDAPRPKATLYAVLWRWHFFAGLAVMPFLLLLSVTGGLYLFKDELDHVAYASLEDVPPAPSPSNSLVQVMQNTEAATGGHVLALTLPDREDRAVRMILRSAEGEPLTAFADPHTGAYRGATYYGGIMQTIRKLHSLQLFGPWASALIEIAAGWTIVLVITGVILWFPRGQKGGVVTIRGTPSKRVFWRDVHAVTGLFAGAVVLFLAVTGMPWSMVWGDYVQRWTTEAHLGQPTPPAETVPSWRLTQAMTPEPADKAAMPSHHHGSPPTAEGLPWALETAPVPPSTAGGAPIDIDKAAEIAREAGLPRPMTLTLPSGPKGAWVAAFNPDEIQRTRTLYIDQFDGHILGDIGYADYGPAAKAIEWGIAVHQGQQFGGINRYVMLAGCVAIVVLAISSITMWWKRRPKGGFGAPPLYFGGRAALGAAIGLLIAGAIYPLLGVTIIAAMAIEAVAAMRARSIIG